MKAWVAFSEDRSLSNDYGAACRASAISTAGGIDVLALLLLPIYAANGGFGRAMAIGLGQNALQALWQGILAGPAAMYLFTFSIRRFGVTRAAVVAAIAPPLTLLAG